MKTLRFSTAVMEWTSLYVGASLVILIVGSVPVPAGGALLALFMPLVLYRLSTTVRVRRLTTLGASIAALLLSLHLSFATYGGFSPGSIAAATGWLRDNPVAAVFLGLITTLFWIQGFRLGMDTELSYPRTVRRFDTGIGVVTVVALVRMGFQLTDPYFLQTAIFYVAVGAVTLSLARRAADGGDGGDDGWTRERRSSAGFLISVVTAGIVLGGTIYGLYPLLTRAAGGAYRSMRRGLAASEPWITRILRAIFGRGYTGPSGAVPAAEGQAPHMAVEQYVEPGAFISLMGRIVAWGFVGLLGVIVVWLLGVRLVALGKSLWRRPDDSSSFPKIRDVPGLVVSWMRRHLIRLISGARTIVVRIFPRNRNLPPTVEAFFLLTRWGRYVGVRRRSCESLGEYGRRLSAAAPDRTQPIQAIISAVQAEYYGAATRSAERERALRRSLAELGSPVVRRIRDNVTRGRYRSTGTRTRDGT